MDVKDYGDVIIIKKQFRSFNDLEIDFLLKFREKSAFWKDADSFEVGKLG